MARARAGSSGEVTALVVFVDIRGFTAWSDTPEVFSNLDFFAVRFNEIIQSRFPKGALVKALGDGAMIVRELSQSTSDKAETIRVTLETIRATNEAFKTYCREFQDLIGHTTDLQLGWSVTCGKVRKLKKDYVGSNVNKCARLCDAARPFGVVIDRVDFPHIPPESPFHFFEQTRKLSGLDEVEVWVTAEISNQFVPRERLKETPEVHVAGMCVRRSDKGHIRLLIARRELGREFYPGLYEGCGGQLALNETFADGVIRHFRKEMGIEVKVLVDLHCFYEIRLPNKPVIPGIRFLCEQVDQREPKSIRHTDTRWVSEADFRDMKPDEFVGELKSQVLSLLDSFKKRPMPH
jgi:isopentenyldiphosphate isomerase